MSRKKQKGLHLGRQADSTASVGWLLPVLSGAAVFALQRLTGISIPWLPALIAAVCSLAARERRWFPFLALLVLSAMIFRARLLDGFCQWYNGMGAIYTAEGGMVLPGLAESGETLNLHIFTCWVSAAIGMGLACLSRWGREVVGAFVLLLCGGVSLALRRMIDPLPLLLAGAMLCAGRNWKHRALPVSILATAVLLSLLPGFAGWAGERSEAVRQQVHHYRYETKYTTLPEGRLEPLRGSDAPALIVTMEKPEVLYLRGFTGAELAEDRWLPLENGSLAESKDLLYWLNSREFDLRAQFQAASAVLDTKKNTVTVQNVGACSAYRYIPFTICADDSLVPENLTETAAGERYDSFTTIYGGAAMLPQVLEALKSEESRYLQAEAAYREFVKAHYLGIPEVLAERMQPYWDKAQGMEPQQAVKAVLEKCYPDGVGHDPYYATAAVLTLRHFGIPARYAEGYILPQTTATTVELTGEHAACWAEVYHDGIGWLPMALTPGLEGETQQEQPLAPDPPEEILPPETEPAAQLEHDGGEQVRIPRLLLSGAILAFLLVILAAAVLVLRRRYILKKRQALLEQEDVREAILWSFADSAAMLERLGIRRGTGSLDALTEPIRERFGDLAAEQFVSASRLHARALFSSHSMTEEDRQRVHQFRATALALLRQNTSRFQRLWMRWILCLF